MRGQCGSDCPIRDLPWVICKLGEMGSQGASGWSEMILSGQCKFRFGASTEIVSSCKSFQLHWGQLLPTSCLKTSKICSRNTVDYTAIYCLPPKVSPEMHKPLELRTVDSLLNAPCPCWKQRMRLVQIISLSFQLGLALVVYYQNSIMDMWATHGLFELRAVDCHQMCSPRKHRVVLVALEWTSYEQFVGWMPWGLRQTLSGVSLFCQANAESYLVPVLSLWPLSSHSEASSCLPWAHRLLTYFQEILQFRLAIVAYHQKFLPKFMGCTWVTCVEGCFFPVKDMPQWKGRIGLIAGHWAYHR